MTVADIHHQGIPPSAVEVAMTAVSESVKEFANAYIERARRQSAAAGAPHRVAAARMKMLVREFVEKCMHVRAEDREAVAKLVLPDVSGWIRMMDSLLDSYEQAEALFNMSPRETRRKHADELRNFKAANKDTEEMKTLMIDLLEFFDPTPESYLEDEMRKIHGDEAGKILKSFENIAESDAFTLDAFKKRHNLR